MPSLRRYLLSGGLAAAALISHSHCLSMNVPSRSAVGTTSLGGPALRHAVLEASAADVSQEASLDIKGTMWMEHINLVVGSRPVAERFYIDYLGFVKDASKSFHVNLGQQQLHLSETGDSPQLITGCIGLAVPSLSAIRERTEEAIETFKGTSFAILDDSDGCISMLCPWGNHLNLYGVDDDCTESSAVSSSQKMVNIHADGGVYGPRMAVRCQPGIRYVEIACHPGTTGGIANFYQDMLGCDVILQAESGRSTCIVSVGPGVHLVYSESEQLSDEAVKAMEGVHICIYANDWKGLYNRLTEKGLVWTNPRFTHLDSCDTWEQAHASRTLCFKDIIDLKTGEKLVELERETRPLRHGQYLKVPFYVPR